MREYLFSNCAIENNNLYFFLSHSGIPAKFELAQGQISILNFNSSLTLGKGDCIDQITAYNGRIYALRNQGDALLIYDMNINECIDIGIDCNKKPWGNFIDMFVYHSKLYIFERYKKSVLTLDCDDNKIKTRVYGFANKQEFICGSRILDRMWLFPKQGNIIGCYNLISHMYEEFSAGFEFCNVIDCTNFENEIYILDRNGCIYCWDADDRMLSLCFSELSLELMGRIVVTNQNIILLPSVGSEIKIYDKQIKVLRTYDQYPVGFKYEANPEWSKYHGRCEDENNIYFAMRSANHLLIIEKESGELSWVIPQLPLSEDIANHLISYKEDPINEGEISLYTFMECSSPQSVKRKKSTKNGEKIWSLMK